MANSKDGYAYLYETVGAGALNTKDGYAYEYENTGAGPVNTKDGFAYTYVAVILYVISGTDGMPPTIN